MLDALRRSTGGWIAKIFIGLLVISFAVWGIADIFRGYGGTSLAKVGDKEISAEEYRFAYQNELRRIGNQIGRNLSTDEARALGLDERVLNRLVTDAALDAHASDLNLGVTDRAIAERTVNEPAFQDTTGRFSPLLFAEVLRANSLSEQAYVALERGATVRRQLTGTIGETAGLPQTLLTAANRYQNETRTLSYFVLPASKAEPIETPTEEQLKSYYDANKQLFTAPDYRKVGLLIVTPETLADTIEVTEEDIKRRYESNKDSYGRPERRHVRQIAFPDKAAAQEAAEKIKGGADFAQIAKERGYSEKDIDLGTVSKSQLADPAVADAAFKLAEGGVSDPVDGSLGSFLLQVTTVEPGEEKSIEDVKDQVRREIAKQRAVEEALEIHDRVEDERAAGIKLSEIGDKSNLKYVELPALSRRGQDTEGKTVDIPALQQVVGVAFESDVGVENDPVETTDRGFVWVDVLGVTLERLKTFEEVRADVERAWRDSEIRRKLSDLAQGLIDRIRKGESVEAVAQSLEIEPKQSKPVKRLETAIDLPRTAIAQAFALGEGGAGSSPADEGRSRIVFKVTKVEPPAPLSEQDEDSLLDAVRGQIADDQITQFVTGLRDRYGVSINRTVYDQLTGREGG